MQQEEEVKPFWGPHRFLQTIVLIRSILTCAVVNASVWTIDCSAPGDPELCRFNEASSAVAVGLAVPLNQLYYLYHYADMGFVAKVLVQVANFVMSWWLMVVLFSAIPRLAMVTARGGLGEEVGSVIGIIYMSYAFAVQLQQMLEGLVSIFVTCYTNATRKPPVAQSLNQDQVEEMKARLKALQMQRDPEEQDNRV